MIQSDNGVINVGLVDDHKLFRKGLVELINDFPGYKVVVDADNGKDLQKALENGICPHVMLLDINMPEMSGYEIAAWLKEFYPSIRVLAVSMNGNEQCILRMLKAGARGYLLKDSDPSELKLGMDEIAYKGYYHSELISSTFFNSIQSNNSSQLSEKELEFLELACSDLTYKEIADKMNLAPRTIDGYRESLFQKLNVKSRVGMALFAIKNNLIQKL